MKKAVFAAGLLFAAAMIAPATAQRGVGNVTGGGDQRYGSAHDMPHDDVARPVSRDAVSRAEDLRLKGQCDKAVPILRSLSDRPGAEISQYNLGLCLFDLAAAEKDSQQAAALRKEAAQSMVSAANAGMARAQAKAVTIYLEGNGMDADPVEAEKWALIYRRNPNRFTFGLPDISNDVRARLDTALNGKGESEAERRADNWAPTLSAVE